MNRLLTAVVFLGAATCAAWAQDASPVLDEAHFLQSGDEFVKRGDLDGALIAALQDVGYEKPSPIQAATIPDALTGRDVLGRASTGAGKTLAFGLPMIVCFGPTPVPSTCSRKGNPAIGLGSGVKAQPVETTAPPWHRTGPDDDHATIRLDDRNLPAGAGLL